jgi:hypothetical protein
MTFKEAFFDELEKIAMSWSQALKVPELAGSVTSRFGDVISRAVKNIAAKGSERGVYMDLKKIPQEVKTKYMRQALQTTSKPTKGVEERMSLGMSPKRYYKPKPLSFIGA